MLLIAELESILRSEEKLNEIIKEELNEIKEKFSTPRRTEIEDSYDEIDVEDLIPNEPMVVTITHNGYVKRVPIKSYERQKRGGKTVDLINTLFVIFLALTTDSNNTLESCPYIVASTGTEIKIASQPIRSSYIPFPGS